MRDLFLLDPAIVFLNHGSFGACPAPVFEAYQRWQRELERNPVEFLSRRSAALLADARAALAAYLGTRAECLVFVPNATHGVNAVARSLTLRPGDEVLSTDHEYGACDNTWEFVCSRSGARLVRAEIPLPFHAEEFLDRVWARVTDRTRVLSISHITSPTALIFPVAELCRRARAAGILTVIDGAHAPGQIPLELDALDADFYAGNCHKWLCAPKGSGFLWARPERHADLDAVVVSWGYSRDAAGHAAYAGASTLERRHQWQGTRDIAAWLAVASAIEFQRAHDWEGVRRRCHDLAASTMRRVCARTGLDPIASELDFGQMAAIPVPPVVPARLKERLFERHRIEVPVTTHGARVFVRLSVQGYNTPAEMDALAEALETELRTA